jgi:hypothetical protein
MPENPVKSYVPLPAQLTLAEYQDSFQQAVADKNIPDPQDNTTIKELVRESTQK